MSRLSLGTELASAFASPDPDARRRSDRGDEDGCARRPTPPTRSAARCSTSRSCQWRSPRARPLPPKPMRSLSGAGPEDHGHAARGGVEWQIKRRLHQIAHQRRAPSPCSRCRAALKEPTSLRRSTGVRGTVKEHPRGRSKADLAGRARTAPSTQARLRGVHRCNGAVEAQSEKFSEAPAVAAAATAAAGERPLTSSVFVTLMLVALRGPSSSRAASGAGSTRSWTGCARCGTSWHDGSGRRPERRRRRRSHPDRHAHAAIDEPGGDEIGRIAAPSTRSATTPWRSVEAYNAMRAQLAGVWASCPTAPARVRRLAADGLRPPRRPAAP